MCLMLLASPSSCLEHSCVAGPAMNYKRKANQEDPRRVSLDMVEPLSQLQHSPTSDPVMGEKQTPRLFKPPKSSFL